MKLSHGQAAWLMVGVTLLWSIAGVVTRQLEQARSFEATFWRSLFTALALLVLLPLVRGRAVFTRLRQAGATLWISGLCWSVMFTAFMLALTLTSVAHVLVTLATGPLLTALVARAVTGQRLPPRTWGAILVAGAGILWIYVPQLAAGVRMTGTLVALCVPVAGAVNWALTQRSHGLGQNVDLVPAVWVGAVLSSLFTLPLALPLQASAHDLAWLALLGLFQLALPCVLAVQCARVLLAPEVALLALLEVVFGIALAWLGAGEAPDARVLTGGGLVIAALVCHEWMGWRQRP